MFPPGLPVLSQVTGALRASFPLEKVGKMPAATQARTISSYQRSRPAPPQELLMTSGARSGRGFWWFRSVGASIHWPAASSASFGQLLGFTVQALAVIHLAPGATPMLLAPPSPPTMVPIVWVPWPRSSQGTPAEHTPTVSTQL